MPALKKYEEETQARAVRMYRDRLAEADGISQRAALVEVGDIPATRLQKRAEPRLGHDGSANGVESYMEAIDAACRIDRGPNLRAAPDPDRDWNGVVRRRRVRASDAPASRPGPWRHRDWPPHRRRVQ